MLYLIAALFLINTGILVFMSTTDIAARRLARAQLRLLERRMTAVERNPWVNAGDQGNFTTPSESLRGRKVTGA